MYVLSVFYLREITFNVCPSLHKLRGPECGRVIERSRKKTQPERRLDKVNGQNKTSYTKNARSRVALHHHIPFLVSYQLFLPPCYLTLSNYTEGVRTEFNDQRGKRIFLCISLKFMNTGRKQTKPWNSEYERVLHKISLHSDTDRISK